MSAVIPVNDSWNQGKIKTVTVLTILFRSFATSSKMKWLKEFLMGTFEIAVCPNKELKNGLNVEERSVGRDCRDDFVNT